MADFVHNRKRRQSAAASLHMLAMSGDYNAQLQFNVAEARSILYETDARRLIRKNAFEKAANSTRRLFGNMEQMQASAQTPWQKQQVALLQKLLAKARENVLAHLSDTSSQTTFILLSKFLGVSPELEQVHRPDHSAKMDAAGFIAKTSFSFIPGAGPILGTAARTGMKIQSTKHSTSRRRGEDVFFDHEASNIVPTSSMGPGSASSSFHEQSDVSQPSRIQQRASFRDPRSSVSPNLERHPRSFQSRPGSSRGSFAQGTRPTMRAEGPLKRAASSSSALRPQRSVGERAVPSRPVQNFEPRAAVTAQQRPPSASKDRASQRPIQSSLDQLKSNQGVPLEGLHAPQEPALPELSEEERYQLAVEMYKKQRQKLKTVLVLKARDRQAKGIAQGKGSSLQQSSSGRRKNPHLEQKKKEANMFFMRLRENVRKHSEM
ncbi:hypothetical protein BWQ96_05817 [Gracilariopsis chorda]|uniref:Uncharacterized protein n=1 Tax=Gracilariopsis chorda TaxID=448386 RepID=A0A2V3IQM6_9FLOR|nr:hypothetical protein BWQ96_05817 [Gracilariopsis chorda]|eukprot:PXF44374.1 hypothetical protein BWQ96_05817 [Gracilariopsis chorda]